MNLNTGGWASPLLRLVARLRSDGLNSTTPVTEINGGTLSATNADIAIVAKGTGATLAQVPDGTTVGGNRRGDYTTDWQKNRNSASMVASGSNSTIGGGLNNRASGGSSIVGGGGNNVASGIESVVAGGKINTASGLQSAVCGGTNNTASSNLSFVGGGENNTAQSNTHATIVGGSLNTASGLHGFIGAGNNNQSSSSYGFVGGGQNNSAQTNTHATVCGGSGNTASGQYSFVGGGQSTTASGTTSVVGGGQNTTASGSRATVGGGEQNLANSAYSCIPGGAYGTTRSIQGYAVFPACGAPLGFTQGFTQSALLLLARQTTNATATVLTSNTFAASTTNQVILPNNAAYSFSGEVIAGVTGGGDTARWTLNGAIKRGANAASTAMVGTPTVTMTHNDAGAAAWTVAVTADTTNGGIKVEVTGAAATTIRWVAKINTTEMTY